MPKTVSDLAKDLGLSSHDLLDICTEEGIEASGRTSVLSVDDENMLLDMMLADSVKTSKKKAEKAEDADKGPAETPA